MVDPARCSGSVGECGQEEVPGRTRRTQTALPGRGRKRVGGYRGKGNCRTGSGAWVFPGVAGMTAITPGSACTMAEVGSNTGRDALAASYGGGR